MRSRPARDAEGGFALIEAIAVLLLSGLVMLTLLIAADLVTRNAGAATRRANAIEGLATGLAALRRDIAGARFARGGATPQAPILFLGGPRAVHLAAGAGTGDGEPPGLVRLEARYEGGRGTLVRSAARLTPDTQDAAAAVYTNPVILLSGPWTYRFSYGATGIGQIAWQESWLSSRALPDVVRLEILGAQAGQQVITPVIVKLRVDAEIACARSDEGACQGSEENEAGDGDEPDDEDGPEGEEAGDGENAGQ